MNSPNGENIVPTQEATQSEPCEDGSQFYKLSTYSMENYSNEQEFGQDLINLLLRTGEIEEKSNAQPLGDETEIPRDERVKSDRYDELIAAFNVILEEILRQGNTRMPNSGVYRISDSSRNINHIQNVGNSEDMLYRKLGFKNRPSKFARDGSLVDPMKKCLSPFEGELLRKVKALNKQLNSFMQKSGDNLAKEKRYAHDSSHDIRNEDYSGMPRRYRQQPYRIMNHFEKPGLIEQTNDGTSTTDGIPTSSTIQKRHTDEAEQENNEQVLNKENNFGVDLQKFVNYLEDEIGKSERQEEANSLGSQQTEGSNDEKSSDSNNLQTPRQKGSNSLKYDIQIPMRLVRKSDGRVYLALDRRSLCQRGRCKRRKS